MQRATYAIACAQSSIHSYIEVARLSLSIGGEQVVKEFSQLMNKHLQRKG
jgi:hypothetical protein